MYQVNFIKKIREIGNSGELSSIAVIDTGTNSHPDLVDNMNLQGCAVFGSSNPDVKILNQNSDHGAKVTSVICATNNKFKLGVANKSKYIPIRVRNEDGLLAEKILLALDYASTLPIDLINISVICPSTAYRQDLDKIIERLYQKNIPVICAAGNAGSKCSCYPACNKYSFSVGSANIETMKIASYSNWGYCVDFLVPMEEYITTKNEDSYKVSHGTSYGCAILSGVISIIITQLKIKGLPIDIEYIRSIIIDSCINTKNLEGLSKHGVICPEKLVFNILKI